MEPRTEKRKNPRAPARRGTPVRNGLLLLILLAVVAALAGSIFLRVAFYNMGLSVFALY